MIPCVCSESAAYSSLAAAAALRVDYLKLPRRAPPEP